MASIKWPTRGARRREAPPGVRGTARVGRHSEALVRRLGPGDVAVLDQVDLDRSTATALLDAGVVAVVNASPSISGRYPNLGPEILTAAGVTLVDDAGATVLRDIKDGAGVRIDDGAVYVGDREVARGFAQSPETVADLLAEARSGLSDQLAAFSANTTEFVGRERGMLLDGVGVPAVRTPLKGRRVVVVAPGPDHAAQLKALRPFLREYRPVLVGVGAGAAALRAARHTPAIVLGTATELEPDTARRATDVVVPADPDGHIAGLARLQDSGIEPAAFASSANPEDMALMLAHTHGAALVVAVGFDATLGGFLDRGRSGSNPSTFLTRLRLGPALVDGSAVAALHRSRITVGAVALLLVAALAALVVAVLVTGTAGPLLALLADGVRAVLGVLHGHAP